MSEQKEAPARVPVTVDPAKLREWLRRQEEALRVPQEVKRVDRGKADDQ
jgi:hypothetical protein